MSEERIVRADFPLYAADAWKHCPEHGPNCVGADCCCAGRHDEDDSDEYGENAEHYGPWDGDE